MIEKISTNLETSRVASNLLTRLFGPSADEIGLTLADNFRIRRLKNQIRNFEKIEKIIDKEKISIKQVDLKVLVPYLDGVAMEEDENLQNLWARLMINYLDSTKNLTSHVYPIILKQISTDELRLLESLEGGKLYSNNPNIKLDILEEVANLERIGILAEDLLIDSSYDQSDLVSSGSYFLTYFGAAFLDACGVVEKLPERS